MKKISLKNLNLKEVEQLSREQLKNVLGGWVGSTGGTDGEGITTEGEESDGKCPTYPGLCEGSCKKSDGSDGSCGKRHSSESMCSCQ